jgi:hypothetical protein
VFVKIDNYSFSGKCVIAARLLILEVVSLQIVIIDLSFIEYDMYDGGCSIMIDSDDETGAC